MKWHCDVHFDLLNSLENKAWEWDLATFADNF